jgi:hypothetical protein
MVGGLAHSGRVIFAAGAETVAVFPTFAGEEDRGSIAGRVDLLGS